MDGFLSCLTLFKAMVLVSKREKMTRRVSPMTFDFLDLRKWGMSGF